MTFGLQARCILWSTVYFWITTKQPTISQSFFASLEVYGAWTLEACSRVSPSPVKTWRGEPVRSTCLVSDLQKAWQYCPCSLSLNYQCLTCRLIINHAHGLIIQSMAVPWTVGCGIKCRPALLPYMSGQSHPLRMLCGQKHWNHYQHCEAQPIQLLRAWAKVTKGWV